jgi:hypothetical protein
MSEFVPGDWVREVISRVDSGDLSLEQALHAAALVPLGSQHDVTETWQCILIALGHEELAVHFTSVIAVIGEAGAGVSVKGDGTRPLGLDDLMADELRAVNTASMAILRRHGIPAIVGAEGELTFGVFDENDEHAEQIIQQFITELATLDEPPKGWGKWLRGGET